MSALNVNSFRDLTVWHAAMELAVDCYRLADTLPPSEQFGLIAQIETLRHVDSGKHRGGSWSDETERVF